MKKKIIIALLVIIALLGVNQGLYLKKVQFVCEHKINSGEALNKYEVFSAMQTHSMFWLLGWIIEPNTAVACFYKQFHITNPIYYPQFPEDDETVKKAKEYLLKKNDPNEKLRLTWKKYTSKASIYLNGSYLSLWTDELGTFFHYEIPYDYKPGIINIGGITISETVFDYLENQGVIGTFTDYRIQKLNSK